MRTADSYTHMSYTIRLHRTTLGGNFVLRRIIAAAVCLVAAAGPVHAQHSYSTGGSYDAAVPTPQSVLGYNVGDRFTMHHMIVRYVERLAATSRRIHVDTVGFTHEGRPMLSVVLTSEANQSRIAQIKGDVQRIADPRG